MNKPKDIPGEVWQVFAIQWSDTPVGTGTYEKCQAIIDKYPEHFPWEHKYKAVPKEVHDAYKKEMGYDWDSYLKKMPRFDGVKKGDGIMSEMIKGFMSKEEYDEKTANPAKTIRDFFDGMSRREE